MEPQYTEIVDIEAVDRLLLLIGVAAPVVGALLGLVLGAVGGRPGLQALRGLMIGLSGPVVLGLWRFYRYMIRLDPETGYVGLHRMSVYMFNIVLFVVVGALLGVLYVRLAARLWPPRPHAPREESPEETGSPNMQGGV